MKTNMKRTVYMNKYSCYINTLRQGLVNDLPWYKETTQWLRREAFGTEKHRYWTTLLLKRFKVLTSILKYRPYQKLLGVFFFFETNKDDPVAGKWVKEYKSPANCGQGREQKEKGKRKKKEKRSTKKKGEKLELRHKAARTKQLPLGVGVQAGVLHDAENVALHPRVQKFILQLDAMINVLPFEEELRESPSFPPVVNDAKPNFVFHLGGRPLSPFEDNIIHLQPQSPEDSTAKDKPNIGHIFEPSRNARIEDTRLPIELGPATVLGSIRSNFVDDKSAPGPRVLSRSTFPKPVQNGFFEPDIAGGAHLVDGRPQQDSDPTLDINAASPFVDGDNKVPDGPKEASLFPSPGTVPNMLPFELKWGGKDATPFLLRNVRDDVTLPKQFPPHLSAVAHKRNTTGPTNAPGIPGQLIHPAIIEIDLVSLELLAFHNAHHSNPVPGAIDH
jgi:hypothetical protein